MGVIVEPWPRPLPWILLTFWTEEAQGSRIELANAQGPRSSPLSPRSNWQPRSPLLTVPGPTACISAKSPGDKQFPFLLAGLCCEQQVAQAGY